MNKFNVEDAMAELGRDDRIAKAVVERAQNILDVNAVKYSLQWPIIHYEKSPNPFDWKIDNLNISIGFKEANLDKSFKEFTPKHLQWIKKALVEANEFVKLDTLCDVEARRDYNANIHFMAAEWGRLLIDAVDKKQMFQDNGIGMCLAPPEGKELGVDGHFDQSDNDVFTFYLYSGTTINNGYQNNLILKDYARIAKVANITFPLTSDVRRPAHFHGSIAFPPKGETGQLGGGVTLAAETMLNPEIFEVKSQIFIEHIADIVGDGSQYRVKERKWRFPVHRGGGHFLWA